MRHKILVITADIAEQKLFEEILQEIIEKGGELILCKTGQEALSILQKEHIRLIFIDSSLYQPAFASIDHLIVLCNKENEDTVRYKKSLFRPLQTDLVLQYCHHYIKSYSSTPPRPM